MTGIAVWFWPETFSFFRTDETPINNENIPSPQTITLPTEETMIESEKSARGGSASGGKVKIPERTLIENVPFTVQAPFGEWSDPVFQNACEEASLVMAAYWLSGKPLSKEIAKQEIIALSRFEENWLGHSIDTSAEDTLTLFRDYYNLAFGRVHTDAGIADIQSALAAGSIVIVPADGRKLGNPHFTQPGPPRHMLVVIGYDVVAKEFITNDPGTKHGDGYRYPENVLYDAILDYPTGDHLPIKVPRKAMIVIGKM
ncbi:MAG: C39 family peptidase [Candidatus Moraniibacteriota bacterium]